MTATQLKPVLVEYLGTFILVFIGALSVTVAPQFGVMVPALAHGLIVTGLIYTYGHISGTHINPAVTIGLLVGGKIDAVKAGSYIAAQFAGGIAAAVLMVALIPDTTDFNYGITVGLLTENHVWNAVVFEVILTFFLVSAVYQVGVFGKAGNLAGVVIGFTLTACILAGGPYTGASLNPARTLGPALMDGNFDYVIPYFVGIFGGGILAGLLHSFVLNPDN